jgi:hypothetical protein
MADHEEKNAIFMVSGFVVEIFKEVLIATYTGNFSQCLVLRSRNCSSFIRRLKKRASFFTVQKYPLRQT